MKDIYVIVKDIDSNITVLSADFDGDRAIIKADLRPENIAEGYIDIIEKVSSGRIAFMTLEAGKYEGLLEREEVESLYEFTNLVELTDCNDDAFSVVIGRIMERLPESDDKTEWIEELGLDRDVDNDELFDLDSMIINKD